MTVTIQIIDHSRTLGFVTISQLFSLIVYTSHNLDWNLKGASQVLKAADWSLVNDGSAHHHGLKHTQLVDSRWLAHWDTRSATQKPINEQKRRWMKDPV